MSYTASEIKSTVAGFFRYKKQCPIVAFEASNRLEAFQGVPADILVVTKARMLYEIEVKISCADMRQDIKKRKHWFFSNRPNELPVNKFYFAVPVEIEEKAISICESLYPYAGLLVVTKFPFKSNALSFGVKQVISPTHLNNKHLSIRDIMYMVKAQSGTVCRLARDVAIAKADRD